MSLRIRKIFQHYSKFKKSSDRRGGVLGHIIMHCLKIESVGRSGQKQSIIEHPSEY